MKRVDTITPMLRLILPIIILLAAAVTAVEPAHTSGNHNKTQSEALPADTNLKQKPLATVKVQVETAGAEADTVESEIQSGSTVKVEVRPEAEKEKPKSAGDILPSPDKPIAPIETEAIDKAGKRVGRKIEEIGEEISCTLGSWVNEKSMWGISWLKLAFFSACLLGVFLFAKIVGGVIEWRLQKGRHDSRIASWKLVFLENLKTPVCLFIYVYGFYGALSLIFVHFEKPFGPNVLHNVAEKAADIGGGIALVWVAYGLVRIIEERVAERSGGTESKSNDLLVSIVGKTLRMATVFVGAILILQNLTGIEAGPLLASFGIGGLALALAAKEPLMNIFGTFTVLFDKPFRVGDTVVIENYCGVVESVGYRSTRIVTLNGQTISVPNQKVINSTVENLKERPYILWETVIRLSYDTPSAKLDRALAIIKELLSDHEHMTEDRPPRVYFAGFGDWSLNISINAWYNDNDWWEYNAWIDRTCAQIKKRFEEEGIDMAIPANLTHLKGPLPSDPTDQHGANTSPSGARGWAKAS